VGKKKTDEFNEAYDLYCNTELTQKQIAGITKVSEAQLSKWSKANDWELDRSARQVTAEKLIREYYQQLAAINKEATKDKRSLNSSETDQIIKITNAIEKLRKKYNLSAYHSVMRECLEWMVKYDAEKAKDFAPMMLEFLKEKSQQLTNDKNIG
jgi:DNA-binding transcriptional regulator YiaG